MSQATVQLKRLSRQEFEDLVNARVKKDVDVQTARLKARLAYTEGMVREMTTKWGLEKEINKGSWDELEALRRYPAYALKVAANVLHNWAVGLGGILNADKFVHPGIGLADIPWTAVALIGGVAAVLFGVFSNQGLYAWASTYPGEYELSGALAIVLILGILLIRRGRRR